ncbi:hypothetical protein Tco_1509441 [Tanacetum coccineum]
MSLFSGVIFIYCRRLLFVQELSEEQSLVAGTAGVVTSVECKDLSRNALRKAHHLVLYSCHLDCRLWKLQLELYDGMIYRILK